MTKEQVQEEYIKLQQQHYEDRQRIIKEAKENGTWIGGFDGNEELFAESNRILKEKQNY